MVRVNSKLGLACSVVGLLETILGLTVLVGCILWKHHMGIIMSSLLIVCGLVRVGAVYSLIKRESEVTGSLSILAGVPKSMVKNYNTGINANFDSPSYADVADARKVRGKTRSRCIFGLQILRMLAEIALILIVMVQAWARFSTETPNWKEWEDVPTCTTSNCAYLQLSVNNEKFNDVLYCTDRWLHDKKREKTIFDDHTSETAFTHARFLSFMFPFPDDMAVFMNETVVEAHSKARLGTNDFHVNRDRLDDYAQFLIDCMSSHNSASKTGPAIPLGTSAAPVGRMASVH
ncbi:hypothetical protein DIPPA_13803 [Diplonema papillatum]|nr:hypothetical protein DIPPA_13803 [Diplonema papillatum]